MNKFANSVSKVSQPNVKPHLLDRNNPKLNELVFRAVCRLSESQGEFVLHDVLYQIRVSLFANFGAYEIKKGSVQAIFKKIGGISIIRKKTIKRNNKSNPFVANKKVIPVYLFCKDFMTEEGVALNASIS